MQILDNMAKLNTSTADSKYQEVWRKFILMVEKDHQLKSSKFYSSVSVNKQGFKDWMSSHGYGETFDENRKHALKQLMGESLLDNDLQEIEDQGTIVDSDVPVAKEAKETPSEIPQYWWLNVDPETWDIEKAYLDEEKIISFFSDKKGSKDGFDGIFRKWLYCYFIDRADNPHFSCPINIHELGISYLDYAEEKLNKESVDSVRKIVMKAESSFLGNMGIVTNPKSILGNYNKNRSDKSWITSEADYGKKSSLRHRTIERKKVDYFYRNRPNEIPRKDKERLLAPSTDPELSYPNIKDITPFSLANEGDFVFACSTSRKHIFAFLEIISKSEDQVRFKVIGILDIPCPISALKEPYCNYCLGDNLGFFRLTSSIGKEIIKGIEEETGIPVNETSKDYSVDDLLHDVYIDKKDIISIFNGLDNKKNIILQGAPGVGKTYLAKRLAFARMGKKYNHRICSIQFHPNYTYEDFIMGYKPDEKGLFKLQEGIFVKFCKTASKDKKKNDYYFIIDEINRGNLSKIFGEVFTLMDKDHRDEPIELACSGMPFRIPKNVHIIGLMNTADRSIAMLDFALRRRFAFFTLKPAFDTSSFRVEQYQLGNEQFNNVINSIVDLNNFIADKKSGLGAGFCIGHSFFCNEKGLVATHLEETIEQEIIPLIREYWFDDDTKFEEQSEKLRKALIKHKQ